MEIALVIIAGLCGLAGTIWICVVAVQNDEVGWAVVCLLCGIVAIVYAIQNFDQCKIPLALIIIGFIGNIVAQALMI